MQRLTFILSCKNLVKCFDILYYEHCHQIHTKYIYYAECGWLLQMLNELDFVVVCCCVLLCQLYCVCCCRAVTSCRDCPRRRTAGWCRCWNTRSSPPTSPSTSGELNTGGLMSSDTTSYTGVRGPLTSDTGGPHASSQGTPNILHRGPQTSYTGDPKHPTQGTPNILHRGPHASSQGTPNILTGNPKHPTQGTPNILHRGPQTSYTGDP